MKNTELATKVISTVSELAAYRSQIEPGEKVIFVPTMGALHAGHLALMERARDFGGRIIVSIFVNPLQFGPNEDLSKYPRPFEADLDACSKAGVDAIFHPEVAQIYPENAVAGSTTVVPSAMLTERLCGLFRPGHFTGVATVVNKLFNLVRPDVAIFGEKDFQQLAVIKRMVEDLNMPLEIISVPTVREPDGLAMSSRNLYLSPEQRQKALCLPRMLEQVRKELLKCGTGTTIAPILGSAVKSCADESTVQIQYLEVCDADNLQLLESARFPLCVLGAIKIGSIRLIDNIIVWSN